MLCLGIETSCDETALAFVHKGHCIGHVLKTQVKLHKLFGGVVPEIASREHYAYIGSLYDELISNTGVTSCDIEVISVTRGPGLLGALLVGLAFAKGLSLALNVPLLGIHHLHAHLLVAGIEKPFTYPALGLLVSGGHTHIYKIESPRVFFLLGRTLDDAAGEACDKFAKMLGLPYPGGIFLDKLAQQGVADPSLFPRPYTNVSSLDFSFSGLKTAAAQYIQKNTFLIEEGKSYSLDTTKSVSQALCNVCASYMLAVTETLSIKMEKAIQKNIDIDNIVVAGGVAANTFVRKSMQKLVEKYNKKLYIPSHELCTDNGIMIGYTGELLASMGLYHDLTLSAVPRGQYIPSDMLQV